MARNKERPKEGAPPTAQSRKSGAAGQGGAGLSLWLRLLLSLVFAWHLFAVFISPLSVRPSSELVGRLAQPIQFEDWPIYLGVQWYTDPLYLNHGYHFFAPDPPINQLIRYVVLDESGGVVADGEFPNTEQQWPRLYYHRHMMLADQSPLVAPGASPEASMELALRAYARYLLRRHEGVEARLDCVRHDVLIPFEVLEGVDPNDPSKFSRVASVTEYRSQLDQPLLPKPTAEPLPQGGTL